MFIIGLLNIVLLVLSSSIYFMIKKSKSIKVFMLYFGVAFSTPEFVKSFSLSVLAGAIFALVTATSFFQIIFNLLSIVFSIIGALKANYDIVENKKKEKKWQE